MNLFFRVKSKREDGYHNIETVMQAIDLLDYLEVERSEADEYDLPGSNLVIRALHLFRYKTGEDFRVRVHLTKHIPVFAGLGGGSSNAASMLYGLRQLSESKPSMTTLAEWGAELGSDIPFFFTHGRAFCSGRGEILREVLERMEPTPFYIAKPDINLSTPEVYAHCTLGTDPLTLGNDLESAAFALRPSLRTFKESLLALGFDAVQMTGSGSGFFCLGGPSHPHLEGTKFYHVRPIYREKDNWYRYEDV